METPNPNQPAFDEWAIIELFGHQKMAGHVTQAPIGDMLRVDVHETEEKILYTRFINPKAIYAINPTSKEVALAVGRQFAQPPISRWEIRHLLPAPSAAGPEVGPDDDEDEWDSDDDEDYQSEWD